MQNQYHPHPDPDPDPGQNPLGRPIFHRTDREISQTFKQMIHQQMFGSKRSTPQLSYDEFST